MKDFDIEILEQMTKRFNPLPLDDEFLNDRYDWQKNVNGSEWPYYRFFYHLSKMLQPKLIVELGGYQGTAAAHFAAGCFEDIEATVVTIDHHTDPGDELNKKRMVEVVNKYINSVYIQGWTNNEIAEKEQGKHALGDAPNALEFIKKIDQRIDILFIDSWHVYEYAMMDWRAYRPLLNSPALVICDDIQRGNIKDAPISGMMKFWSEMPEPKFLNSNLHPGTQMGFVKA